MCGVVLAAIPLFSVLFVEMLSGLSATTSEILLPLSAMISNGGTASWIGGGISEGIGPEGGAPNCRSMLELSSSVLTLRLASLRCLAVWTIKSG